MIKLNTRLNEKGLTLIELLAVIVILGIIAAIAVTSIMNVIQKARDQAFVGNAIALKEAADFYIRHELTSGGTLQATVSYKMLEEQRFIDAFKDPHSGEQLEPSDDTYVVITGESATAVCLKGTEKNLCTYKGAENAIPISDLITANIVPN
ncbi:type II secretion system protein [Cytobacillus gottheilii]|uniref:type II secretion system protein n=1 Tax=Cytobacillus gottheilii TaxID=859144 RepID=UPI00111A8BDE|nr:prepilin-type N-terminal cleavage/methylation domain-containing protein [Cytobacillus gottheilii]